MCVSKHERVSLACNVMADRLHFAVARIDSSSTSNATKAEAKWNMLVSSTLPVIQPLPSKNCTSPVLHRPPVNRNFQPRRSSSLANSGVGLQNIEEGSVKLQGLAPLITNFKLPNPKEEILAGEMDLACINDLRYNDIFMRALFHSLRSRLELMNPQKCLNVLELSGNWSQAGLMAARHLKSCQVVTVVQSTQALQAYNAAMNHYRLRSNMSVICEETSKKCLAQLAQLMMQKEEKFDVMIVEVLEGSGLIRQNVLEDICFASKFLLAQNAPPGGAPSTAANIPRSPAIVLPHSIHVFAKVFPPSPSPAGEILD